MNGDFVSVCPLCTAGRPGCEYGFSIFLRVRYLEKFIPDVWPDAPTPEQVGAFEEWHRLGDAYCVHIGLFLRESRVV